VISVRAFFYGWKMSRADGLGVFESLAIAFYMLLIAPAVKSEVEGDLFL
jgi:hypothetical protein